MAASCQPTDEKPIVRVSAAISTRAALLAIEPEYERISGVDLRFNFGSSNDLARQIISAGGADLFLSADEVQMNRVEQAGQLVGATRIDLLANQLAVVELASTPTPLGVPFDAKRLASEEVQRISIGEPNSVPAGRYARRWLESMGLWTSVESKLIPALDARSAVAAVEAGGADVGIVYATDAALAKSLRVAWIVPYTQEPRISYPMALIAGGNLTREPYALWQYLQGEQASRHFQAQGFVVLGR
jgi:molybdate transport system substrate-binding protein